MPTSAELFAEVRTLDKDAREEGIRVAELRTVVNAPEVEGDDREAKIVEHRAALEAHTVKLQAALDKRDEAAAMGDAEDWQAQANVAKGVDTRSWTPQQKELRELAQGSGLIDFLGPVIQGNRVDGKADEYRKAIWPNGYPAEWVPLEFLLDRNQMLNNPPDQRQFGDNQYEEHRADTILDQSSMQGATTTAARVFAGGDSAFMGAAMPTVNSGDYNYPVVTGGNATAAPVGTEGTESAAAAATVSLGTATPEWLPASVDVSGTTLVRHPGLEDAFRRELIGQLTEGADKRAIAVLLASLGTITAAGSTSTVASYVEALASGVDGRYAFNMSHIRMLVAGVSAGTADSVYTHLAKRVQANVGFGFMLLPMNQIRASHSLTAVPNTGLSEAIGYKNGVPNPNEFVMPMWRGVQMLRDPLSSKREGLIEITANLLMDAVAPRGANGAYYGVGFDTA